MKNFKILFPLFIVNILLFHSCGKEAVEDQIQTYVVTFSDDSGKTIETQEVNKNAQAVLPKINLVKEGYKLVGWTLDKSPFEFSNSIIEDITLSPIWQIITYEVRFLQTQGGREIAKFEVNHGAPLPQNTIENPTRDQGYRFLGWEINGLDFDFSNPIMAKTDIYAQWIKTYRVEFNTNGGFPLIDYKTVDEGSIIKVPSAPTKDGYIFLNWFENGVNLFDFNEEIYANTVLVAQWKEDNPEKANYTVTLDSDGGNDGKEIIYSLEEGDILNSPLFSPKKSGFEFVEWQDNGQKFVFGKPITKDVRLKALWKDVTSSEGGDGSDKFSTGTVPEEPTYTAKLGQNTEKEIVLSWENHTDFGETVTEENGETVTNPTSPATPAYKIEMSTDGGTTFITLPSGDIKLLDPKNSEAILTENDLADTIKEVVVSGLSLGQGYHFRVSAINTNKTNNKSSFVNPDPLNTLEEEKVEASKQTSYQSEEHGAPARANWVDTFRNYPEIDFLKNGRYVLVWRKDPGNIGPNKDYNPAERWELHQILFKDPNAMKDSSKFGQPIDPFDIEDTVVLVSKTADPPSTSDVTEVMPNDLLPPTSRSSTSSTDAGNAPIELPLVADSQYGYFAINGDNNALQSVVAYKVRLFRTIQDVDSKGNPVTKEVFNDGEVVFVNWREGKVLIAHQDGSTGGGQNKPNMALVPDKLTSIDDVRKKLNLPLGAYFTSNWENNKIPDSQLAPIEELITKDDFAKLFPHRQEGHDKNGTYYSWENLVKASKYFPKFLNEGTKEDRYRELASLLGNKSQEIGRAIGSREFPGITTDERYSYGLYFIVELSALSGVGNGQGDVDNQDDLYKAFSSNYTQKGNVNYPPVDGKSYHGRGPVQLSWNYNYGQMSEALFKDKSILLENPNLIARDGVLGWASAIWFWMQPQKPKVSAHDVMVGNVVLESPYIPPALDPNKRQIRTYTSESVGHDAEGRSVDYTIYRGIAGLEIGFGMTINIINGGIEANQGDNISSAVARRTIYYAKYLDYFGTQKNGRDDDILEPISPQVGGKGGDPVPENVVQMFRSWKNWYYLPGEEHGNPASDIFPKNEIPSIITAKYQVSIQ